MKRAILPLLLLLFSALPLPVRADIYIIVNKDLHLEQLDKNAIAAIYLLKKKNWDSGESIMPINLPALSSARSHFTSEIFNSSPDKLNSYWDEMLFKGVNPPIIENSEQAVVLFVTRVKGAIGYVETKPQNPQIKIIQQFSVN
jgi:ABC-type phosphate transport system substrate-binding protein